jgi:hypothetical protein
MCHLMNVNCLTKLTTGPSGARSSEAKESGSSKQVWKKGSKNQALLPPQSKVCKLEQT